MPLNKGSLGAEKRGPGTNVAIMLMVRITGDSNYWPYLRLLYRDDHPAAAALITEAFWQSELVKVMSARRQTKKHLPSDNYQTAGQRPFTPLSSLAVSMVVDCFFLFQCLIEEAGIGESGRTLARHISKLIIKNWNVIITVISHRVNLPGQCA